MKNASLSRGALRALLLSLALSGSVAFAHDGAVSAASPAGVAVTNVAPRPVDAAQTKVLMESIKSKNWDGARAAVAAGADVNAADKNGVTPLMRAADACQTDLVELLVKSGANVNAVDKSGQTALHYAVPADPKPKKKFGFGKIMGAMSGGLGLLTGGLVGGNLISSLVGGGGVQSLMGSNLTSLLGGGAFNPTGKSGWSAIAGAALQGDASGNFGIGQLLSSGGMLGQGGKINSLDAANWTNLMSSVKDSNPQIVGAMRNLGSDGDASQKALWGQFLTAASSGDQAGVAKLMKNPELAPVLQQATAGLGAAVSELPGNASHSIIGALIQGGAKADATDKDGKTAADLAKDRGLKDLFATN